jgi:RNA polymerase sigma-70 factor (ECF subfamily)
MDGNSCDYTAGDGRIVASHATRATLREIHSVRGARRVPRRRERRVETLREPDPDDDVLRLAGDGDVRGALRRLMDRHGAAVYRYCREALRDAALADDVHQQVFIEAFRDLARFGRRSTVRTWLFAIARHRVLDAAKARSRAQAHFEHADVLDTPDLAPSPGEAIDDARLHEALDTGLGKLDEQVRTAVLLRFQQGFMFDEMAEICGESSGALRARVARALPVLRASIEAHIAGFRQS